MVDVQENQEDTYRYATFKEASSLVPFIVVEETTHRYRKDGDSRSCSTNGGLYIKRIPMIKETHVFPRSNRNVSMFCNLDVSPHWELPQEQYKPYKDRCVEVGVSCKSHPMCINKLVHTPIATYINFMFETTSYNGLDSSLQEIYNLITKLDNLSSYIRSLEIENNISKLRNSKQSHYGYTGNHSSKVNDDGTVMPNLMENLNIEQRNKFVIMTRIGHLLFESRKQQIGGLSGSFFQDNGTSVELSKEIHTNNRIPARTESINHHTLVGIHCDHLNDGSADGRKSNLNYTLVVHDSIMNPDGTLSSSRDIGYSRSSFADMKKRNEKVEHVYTNKFVPWLKKQPQWRKELTITPSMFNSQYWQNKGSSIRVIEKNLFLTPHFNKQAMYLSGYADAIIKLQAGIGVCQPITKITQTIEMILAIVLCNTAEVYRLVITEIWSVNPPTGNLCVAMARDAVEHYGCLSTGKHNRTLFSFTRDKLYIWARESGIILKNAIELHNTPGRRCSFRSLTKLICGINGIGHLTSQHIIILTSQLSLLPPEYGNTGTMCNGTRAWKRLINHCGLGAGQIPSLHRVVAERNSWSLSVAENVICEFSGDMVPGQSADKTIEFHLSNPRKWDAIYNKQNVIRYATYGPDGESQMVEVRRHDSDRRKKRVLPTYNRIEVYRLLTTTDQSKDIFWKTVLEHEESVLLQSKIIRINRKNRDEGKLLTLPKGKMSIRKNSGNIESGTKLFATTWGTSGKTNSTETFPHVMKIGHNFIKDSRLRFFENMDCSQERNDEDAFIKSQSRTGNFLKKDEMYSTGDGASLRKLYQDGVLRPSSDRLLLHSVGQVCTTEHMIPTIPSITVLLTWGVLYLPFNLFTAAHLSLGLSSPIDFCKKITTHEPEKGKFFCKYMSDTMLTYKDCHHSLKPSQWKMTVGFSAEMPILYRTKKDAKKALLWYLCIASRDSSPSMWISHLYEKNEWLGTSSNGGGSQSYIILSNQQTCHQISDGHEFGVMTMIGDSVWIKVSGKQMDAQDRVTCLTKKNPYVENTVLITNRVKKRKKTANKENTKEDIKRRSCSPQQKSISLIENCESPLAKDNVLSHPALTLLDPDVSIVVKVWETEPFGKNATTQTLTTEQNLLLFHWKPYWSSVLDKWLAYITLRKTGGYDRYWLPPGIISPPVRSRKELISFLDFCKELQPFVDITDAYKQWSITLKKIR
jgi:hypothetical protein